jgi:hypothetical protein
MQWVPGVKRLGHEDDQSAPFSAETKKNGDISQFSIHFYGVVLN